MRFHSIPLRDGPDIPILYEDRSVLAIDKPAGWLLAPADWTRTSRNLLRELMLEIQSREHWARSRNIKYLRFVHRLDAETSGVLLFAKTPGALAVLGKLFETRAVEKVYLAVVRGVPKQPTWACDLKIGPAAGRSGKMKTDRHGKDAETHFRVLQTIAGQTLLLVRPATGRTHQIRVHALAAGLPVVGDELYGETDTRGLALRAVGLTYLDPFQKRPVKITAPFQAFVQKYGFAAEKVDL